MDDLEHIRELLTRKSRRLQKLQQQQATYGIDTPAQILIEIEDLEGEIESLQITTEAASLEKSPHFIALEPRVFAVPTKTWVTQEITLTNFLAKVYSHVELSLQAAWPVNLKQKKLAVDNLVLGVGQTVQFDFRVDAETDQVAYPVQARLRVDKRPPQTITLQIVTTKEVEPPLPPPPPNLPSIKDFRKELRKLTDEQFIELGDEEAFMDLADMLGDPLLISARKTDKIINFCKHRRKFPELHQALQEILGPAYRFYHDKSAE